MSIEVATVNAASKFDQKVTSAPSYVTVITAEEIQRYGYRTLAEILESVPGFYVTNDRNYSYLGVRGFDRSDYNDRVLLLIDGHRTNDPVYGEALIGTEFPLDVDLIQRVEIIRGPGSALYGTNAFFAVINVITKRGRDVKDAQVSAEAGSLGTYKERGTFGTQRGSGTELLLSGSFYNSYGNRALFFPELDSPATNNGVAVNVDGDESYDLLATMEVRGLSLQGLYGSRTKVIPTGSFGTVFGDPRNRTTDALGYFDAKYEHQLGAKWHILGRLAYDHASYHGTYVYDDPESGPNLPALTLNEDFSVGERVSLALDASRTLFDRHRVTIGTEDQINLKQNQWNYDQLPYILFLNDHRQSTVPALYLQDEYSIRNNLIFTAGVRWDHYDTFGSTENPRLGLIYSPREKTTLKLLYGTAFRAPNDYELYYASPPNQVPSLSLQPETIRTTEVVFEQYFAVHANAEIAGFYNDIRNLISQQTTSNNLLLYENSDAVHSEGIDCAIAGKWPGGLQGRLSYTFQQSVSQVTGSALSNSPANLAKLNVSAPIVPRRLFASLETQYSGAVETFAGTEIGGFVVVNATVSAPEITHGLAISASAYNLMNKRYADAVSPGLPEDSVEQDGRTLRVKVTYQLGGR